MSTTTTIDHNCRRYRQQQQQQGTVSVEDVDGLSSGHLDVLHIVALPGLESLPFPSSDQHHARLTSMSVNLDISQFLINFKHSSHRWGTPKLRKSILVGFWIKVAVTRKWKRQRGIRHSAIWQAMGGMVHFWTLGCASENKLAMPCNNILVYAHSAHRLWYVP